MKRVPFGSIKSSFLKDCTKDVTPCHLSSYSSKTLQRSTYCSGEYSKYTVQVKIQLQTDNKLNVQLLGYPPIYEANRTVECQINPPNTKHHKIQNQGKKGNGIASSVSVIILHQQRLTNLGKVSSILPSYNPSHPILQHFHFLPTILRCKKEIFLHTTLRCKLLSSAAMETSNNLSFQAHNS